MSTKDRIKGAFFNTPTRWARISYSESLFGTKPDTCSADFEMCGDCNIYPCLIGCPSLADESGQKEE